MKKDGVFDHNFENAERIGYLVASYLKGTLTPLERRELDEWILESEANELFFDELTSDENIEKTMLWYASINEEKAAQRLKKRISFTAPNRRTVSYPFMLVAASLVIVMSVAVIYLITRKQGLPAKESNPVVQTADLLPGSDKAVLTLGDGRKIILDSTAPGSIGANEINIQNGTVFYNAGAVDHPSENLITVPRGGQYKLVLSDGTKVWLNAESSLRYVTAFTISERKVELTGEGYFEVSKNKEKPFIVESPAGTIKVLGTQFNINAYGNGEPLATTLVEGSVEITKAGVSKILKPGQQAKTNENGVELVGADLAEVLAWKDGNFVFRDAPVTTIVNQLARWYDLQVEFRDPVEKHLNATIKRNLPLSKVLHYLEETGDVHFKVEGRKLAVFK